jgi:LemA protein
MVNPLDEVTGPVESEGRDVNVIAKQLKVTIGANEKIFESAIWFVGLPVAFGIGYAASSNVGISLAAMVLGLLPGVIFQFMKANALAYLRKLEQKVQADASQIDNYLEQRLQILQNLVGLLEKSIELDKDVMKTLAAYRSGIKPDSDTARNEASAALDGMASRINVAFEAYPNLKAQDNIAEAMRQNSYLQKEITAARTLYNDTVATWNRDIFAWPTKLIVAARNGFNTRIPFIASAEVKAAARDKFF